MELRERAGEVKEDLRKVWVKCGSEIYTLIVVIWIDEI